MSIRRNLLRPLHQEALKLFILFLNMNKKKSHITEKVFNT